MKALIIKNISHEGLGIIQPLLEEFNIKYDILDFTSKVIFPEIDQYSLIIIMGGHDSANDNSGSQCVVVSIDVKKTLNGAYEVYTHSGTKPTGKDPVSVAKEVEKRNAGEIILSSIDLDGTMQGYDIELIERITSEVSIPVIASGGAGNYEHMLKAIKNGGASAVAAAAIFHFTQQTPMEAKKYLNNHGVNVRIYK